MGHIPTLKAGVGVYLAAMMHLVLEEHHHEAPATQHPVGVDHFHASLQPIGWAVVQAPVELLERCLDCRNPPRLPLGTGHRPVERASRARSRRWRSTGETRRCDARFPRCSMPSRPHPSADARTRRPAAGRRCPAPCARGSGQNTGAAWVGQLSFLSPQVQCQVQCGFNFPGKPVSQDDS